MWTVIYTQKFVLTCFVSRTVYCCFLFLQIARCLVLTKPILGYSVAGVANMFADRHACRCSCMRWVPALSRDFSSHGHGKTFHSTLIFSVIENNRLICVWSSSVLELSSFKRFLDIFFNRVIHRNIGRYFLPVWRIFWFIRHTRGVHQVPVVHPCFIPQ